MAMPNELIYTSLPRGLIPGSQGFCLAAATQRIPSSLCDRVEKLNVYLVLSDFRDSENPPSFGHYRVMVGGVERCVISRVGVAGRSYTKRVKIVGHHWVLNDTDRAGAGPAWMLRQPGVVEADWTSEPMYRQPRNLPVGDRPPSQCDYWEQVSGDAGWAGVLADAFIDRPHQTTYIIVPRGTDSLRLIEEAIALLPHAMRWQVTFATHYSSTPAGTSCNWRVVSAGTDAVRTAQESPSATIIDLTASRQLDQTSQRIDFARTGQGILEAETLQTDLLATVELSRTPKTSTEDLRQRQTPLPSDFETYDVVSPIEPILQNANERKAPSTNTQVSLQRNVQKPVETELSATERMSSKSGISVLFWSIAILWPLAVLLAWSLLNKNSPTREREVDTTSKLEIDL